MFLSIFSWIAAFFSSEPKITEIYSETGMFQEISYYIVPALAAEDVKIYGQGRGGRVGVDPIFIDVKIREDDGQKLKERAFKAHKIATEAMGKAKVIWNMTNHGPTSPCLIRMAVDSYDKFPFFAVSDERIISPWESCITIEKGSELDLLIRNNVDDEPSLSAASYYLTRIEASQKAVGINLYFKNSDELNQEQYAAFFLKQYHRLKKSVEDLYGLECFFMLSISHNIRSEKAGYITTQNIRQHIVVIDHASKHPIFPFEMYFPNALHDVVPESLKRKLYVPENFEGKYSGISLKKCS